MDEFSRFHPLVNFSVFAAILIFSMLFMHPVCLAVSMVCALGYSIYLNGARAVRTAVFAALPMLLFTALVNPIFNHRGATVLAYFPWGNPLTLESVFYGIAAGAMLAVVILWFSCINKVFTSDKFIYLFGRLIPGLSLVLSMILRFVPRFSAELKRVSQAQKCLMSSRKKGFIGKIKNAAAIFSIMITWSLENGLDTADSMKSRGYGLEGRGSYTTYRISRRDVLALCFVLLCAAIVIASMAVGAMSFAFYPTVTYTFTPMTAAGMGAFTGICLVPITADIKEDLAWKRTA